MTPVEASVAARRKHVSLLQPPPRNAYSTKDLVAARETVPVVAEPEPAPVVEPEPTPKPRRRRQRKAR